MRLEGLHRRTLPDVSVQHRNDANLAVIKVRRYRNFCPSRSGHPHFEGGPGLFFNNGPQLHRAVDRAICRCSCLDCLSRSGRQPTFVTPTIDRWL